MMAKTRLIVAAGGASANAAPASVARPARPAMVVSAGARPSLGQHAPTTAPSPATQPIAHDQVTIPTATGTTPVATPAVSARNAQPGPRPPASRPVGME